MNERIASLKNVLVPENVKNIANRTLTTNLFVNDNERAVAQDQIIGIRDFCNEVISKFNTKDPKALAETKFKK